MLGTIEFEYLAVEDIVIGSPHWHIQKASDILRWLGQFEAYLKPYNRRMDMVVVLDDFDVDAVVGIPWGDARARMHQQHTRFTCRVRSRKQAQLFMYTSGVRHNVSTTEAPTVDAAIASIMEARRGIESPRRVAPTFQDRDLDTGRMESGTRKVAKAFGGVPLRDEKRVFQVEPGALQKYRR